MAKEKAPKYLQTVEARKSKYLKELSSDEDSGAKTLERNFAAIHSSVFRSYLPEVQYQYAPHDLQAQNTQVACFELTKWVEDSRENSIEKLSNVYQTLVGEPCSVALIYRRNAGECHVQFAVADQAANEIALAKRVCSALTGNFPGSEYSDPMIENLGFLQKDVSGIEPSSIAVVTNIATEKSEKFISQSIEKLLDGLVPALGQRGGDYTIMLLGEPVNDSRKYEQRLYDYYTALSPFASIQTQQTVSESMSVMRSVNVSESLGVFGSTQTSVSASVGGAGTSVGVSKGYTVGASVTASVGQQTGNTDGVGKSDGRITTYTNYEVKHTLSMIETQMKRLEQCRALGMWRFAAYVLSGDPITTKNVAHMYASLTQGEESYLEPAVINTWDAQKNADMSCYIRRCLSNLQHPVFCLKQDVAEEKLIYPTVTDLTTIVSGKELARALNFPQKSVPGLPVIRCAAFGRNVMSKDKQYHGDIHLGCIYHMQKREETIPVNLNADRLAMHTFITGSTGSGKSNTIYQLLHELGAQGRKFLVVEPAKGEYRAVFGSRSDVTVYGTNPNLKETALLRLNPFSFPENVHVYEHMDRLVEIFNVCWPMYAAKKLLLLQKAERIRIPL